MPDTSTEADARAVAAAAAERSRATIRGLSELDELAALVDLLDRVWSTDGSAVIGLEHLRALAHAGNYVSGAFDLDSGALLGGTVGFFGAPAGHVLHSDVTGVDASARERRLGFALKLHQRAWCLDHGISEVTWTFDPLIARNAYFNLVKLGATVARYYVDFYGDMDDGINAGQGSDRLLICWDLSSPRVVSASAGVPARAASAAGVPTLLSAVGRAPAVGSVAGDVPAVLVEIPRDIEAVRRTDPLTARAWRQAVRDTLGAELAAGGSVTGFSPTAGYQVERATTAPAGPGEERP